MHYKNGDTASEGDYVICQPDQRYAATICGRLHSLRPGDSCCEAQVCVPTFGGTANFGVKVSQCLHAASAFESLNDSIERAKLLVGRLPTACPTGTINAGSTLK